MKKEDYDYEKEFILSIFRCLEPVLNLDVEPSVVEPPLSQEEILEKKIEAKTKQLKDHIRQELKRERESLLKKIVYRLHNFAHNDLWDTEACREVDKKSFIMPDELARITDLFDEVIEQISDINHLKGGK